MYNWLWTQSLHCQFFTIKEINFSLVAEEVSGDGEATEVPVTVHITDANDNFPGKHESYIENRN